MEIMNNFQGSYGAVHNNNQRTYTTEMEQHGITNHIHITPQDNFCEYDSWMRQVGSLIRVANRYQSMKPLLDLLVSVIEPDRMFLFDKSSGKGNRYVQIILAVDSSKNGGFSEITRLLKVSCLKYTNVIMAIHDTEILEQGIIEGDPYYSLRCREENLIFSGKCYRLPCTSDIVLNESSLEACRLFDEKMDKATKLFDLAKQCCKKQGDLVCELLEQSLITIYKGILLGFGAKYPKIPDIVELKTRASLFIPILMDIEIFGFSDNDDKRISETESYIIRIEDFIALVKDEYRVMTGGEQKEMPYLDK